MKNKLLASSSTKEGIEKLINQYFYSTSYTLQENQIVGKKGILSGFVVEFKKNKFYFMSIES